MYARHVLKTKKQRKGTAKRVEGRDLSRRELLELGERGPEKVAPQHGWLKEIWGKWPGNESIEELLAALKTER